MQVTWQGVFTPLLGGKAKTTKNILDLNFQPANGGLENRGI